MVNCLALKLIQHGIAIGAIKNLHTGSYFAINLVNCLALKLIQHGIAIRSIKKSSYRLIFCNKFGKFSSPKVDSTWNNYAQSPLIKNGDR